jgi:hypothetical protein
MLYPLSYEGGPAVLRGPEPTVLALVRGFGLGRSVHGWRRGQCLMVVVGSESGGDAVIDFSFLSVDTVGVDLQQHGHVMAEPPGDLGGGTPLLSHSEAAAFVAEHRSAVPGSEGLQVGAEQADQLGGDRHGPDGVGGSTHSSRSHTRNPGRDAECECHRWAV